MSSTSLRDETQRQRGFGCGEMYSVMAGDLSIVTIIYTHYSSPQRDILSETRGHCPETDKNLQTPPLSIKLRHITNGSTSLFASIPRARPELHTQGPHLAIFEPEQRVVSGEHLAVEDGVVGGGAGPSH